VHQPQITLYLLLPADLNGNLRAICTAKIETSNRSRVFAISATEVPIQPAVSL
jgi:hypothetical protein